MGYMYAEIEITNEMIPFIAGHCLKGEIRITSEALVDRALGLVITKSPARLNLRA
jgi:hypothetical protein